MPKDIKNLRVLGFKGVFFIIIDMCVFFSNRKCLALNKTIVYTGLNTNEKETAEKEGVQKRDYGKNILSIADR